MSIGIVVNLAYYHENAELLAAVERAAASEGFTTLIADTADFVGRGEAYGRILRERRVDGLLIASVLVTEQLIAELEAAALPLVVLNRRTWAGGASASVDDALGMSIATEHLVRLGHTRIGYLAGPLSSEPAGRRLEGFRMGMRAATLRTSRRLVAPCGCDAESVFETTTKLLSQRPSPTAFCVWSPTAAVPALAAVKRMGLAIPGDLSVVAYNDSPIMRHLDPPVTSVRMPLDEMARAGVDSLLQLIRCGEKPRSVVVRTPPVLIERASTASAT
jgi:LacI family transcriptional regulator